MPETIEDLNRTIDKADEHTAMLMTEIETLQAQLKAAEFAAKHNWDGWQQEIARTASDARSIRQLCKHMENGHLRDCIFAVCDSMIRDGD